jgi:ferredoxin
MAPAPRLHPVIRRVWVDRTCTACGLCEGISPEVFEVGPDGVRIHPGADLVACDDSIRQAAELCPLGAIHFEETAG